MITLLPHQPHSFDYLCCKSVKLQNLNFNLPFCLILNIQGNAMCLFCSKTNSIFHEANHFASLELWKQIL
jgi:hypothetical protein